MIAQPTETARLRVSRFVSVIDAGRMINPKHVTQDACGIGDAEATAASKAFTK